EADRLGDGALRAAGVRAPLRPARARPGAIALARERARRELRGDPRLVGGAVAAAPARAPRRLCRRPLSGAGCGRAALALLQLRRARLGVPLARRLGSLRLLRGPVRLLQQDLGVARRGRDPAHLALALLARAPLRRRDQRGGRAEPRRSTR